MNRKKASDITRARLALLPKAAALALAVAAMGSAQAQESNFTLVVGVKTWLADWTTWFILQDQAGADFVQQAPAKNKAIMIPQLSMRYGNFVASASAAVQSTHQFQDPGLSYTNKRKEYDVNAGYYVTPGLAATLGYKKFTVSLPNGTNIYDVGGPTLGLSGSAPLASGFSMFGALGVGSLSLKDNNNGGGGPKLKADYRLNEVGLAYTMPVSRFLSAVSFTGSYRTQIIAAKNLLLTDGNRANPIRQDARDITQGFTLGIVAAF